MEVIVKSSPKIEIELATKVVKAGGGDVKADGVYPDLTAGDLAGRGESVPAEFGFRASGGKSIKDGRAYIKRIKGNSVVWNQMLPNSTIQVTSNATRALNEGTRIVVGHKYLLLADFDGGTDYASVTLYARVNGESKAIFSLGNNEGKTYKFVTAEIGGVSNGTGSSEEGNIWQYFYFEGTTESITNTRLIDLTQLFQAGNEPTTIEEFNARVATLGIDMYAYNEGQVIHCNTESIKSVGDNAWDEQWRQGYYIVGGLYNESPTQICSKNPIPVLPNATYCINQDHYYVWYYDKDMRYINYAVKYNKETFVTPSNAAYIHFNLEPPYGTTYKNDIIVTLVHSGWKQDTDAGYQPYWQDTLPLPVIRKYFPDGMKKAGSAHDEIRFNKASGKWEYSEGKIKSVDLGDLEWYEGVGFFASEGVMNIIKSASSYSEIGNMICAKYITDTWGRIYNGTTSNAIGVSIDGQIGIIDSAYTDVATFKADMAGVILYYESKDWEWVELDEADQNFRDYYNVADFGTEMSQSEFPSAAFSADIIYQFNAVDMIREHELEITELQSIIATMQAQLTSLINGGQ